jgi:2-polyprenyl-3-methyl-5-hydroxy-6-metoxy-1,4-benzoquinol methylase
LWDSLCSYGFLDGSNLLLSDEEISCCRVLKEAMKYSSSNVNKYACKHPFVMKRLDRFFRDITAMMSGLNTRSVLSLGCGEGLDLKRIYDESSLRAHTYVGLDCNLDALRMSLTVLDGMPYTAVCGDVADLANLPIKLRNFDLILCLELLEHLPNPRELLEEISRQYAGYCIFSVPNEPLYRLTRMLLFRQTIRNFGNHPDHLNHWSAGSFCKLLESYFKVDRVEKPFPWTVVLCQTRR